MADWLAEAQALEEGRSRKVPHDCGDSPAMIVSHRADGWGAVCFRCDFKAWRPRPAESLSERLARLAQGRRQEAFAERSLALPGPSVHDPQDWPLAARVWLYKAGFSNQDIAVLGVYWCPRIERVVLPVRDAAGALIYWQARTLDPTNDRKYINPSVDKSRLLAKHGRGGLVVLTEDLLSAYKVSRAGVQGWALMGTKLNDHITAEVIRTGLPVAVWLDADAPGRAAARKVGQELRACGVEVRDVVTEKDPKLLSRAEIAATLGVENGEGQH